MANVLLFDLDETLIVEEPAAVAGFRAMAGRAATSYEVDVDALAVAARARARELWRAAPTYGYCRRVGISSWEGLVAEPFRALEARRPRCARVEKPR